MKSRKSGREVSKLGEGWKCGKGKALSEKNNLKFIHEKFNKLTAAYAVPLYD